MGISAVIIAKNESANIAGCVKSLSWCDEVVVVDSFSTDNTVELARRQGARVIQHPFVDYGSQKRFAARQAFHEWVLMIDADERVSAALGEEIRTTLSAPPEITGYRIPMLDLMFGKVIFHGGWGYYYRISLFRKDAVDFAHQVHERTTVRGAIGTMKAPILHFSHFTIDHFLHKLNRYTTLEAREALAQGKRASALKVVLLPPIVFLYKYFWQQGYRDGMHGFALAFMMSTYHFARHVKLWMLQYQHQHQGRIDEMTRRFEAFPRDLP